MTINLDCISWSGFAFTVIGGAIHIFSWTKVNEAAKLEKILQFDRLSGTTGSGRVVVLNRCECDCLVMLRLGFCA
jgi:hypothetical protein